MTAQDLSSIIVNVDIVELHVISVNIPQQPC